MSAGDQFRQAMGEVVRRAGDRQAQVVRKVAIELMRGMVQKSPVDTGRFRGNWQCAVGAVNTLTTTSTANDAEVRTALSVEGWKPGQTIYLTNSLPYAKRLEYGWSKQAPQGMVRLTVQEYATHLQRAIQGSAA